MPARFSPPLLHATGPRAAAGFFQQIGLQPALPSVFAAAIAQIGGGFLIASGLVTPLGTALLAAVMTTAILSVHIRKGDLEHRRWRRAAARAPDDGIRRQCARAQHAEGRT